MSVPEQTPFIEYTANGTTTVFPLTFDCDKAEYLIVTLDGNDAAVGSWSFINNSVNFNSAPSQGTIVGIERNTPLERTTNYQLYNNSLHPKPINKDFDLIWWKLQELGYRDQVIWLALIKEITDRISGDEDLQNQINTIDELLANLQQNVNENTHDIAQLVNDLSKEIANRITGDQILKDMFLSMIDEAINEGTINALAITHLDSLESLQGITNVWDGRTIYVKDLGNYRYDALTTSWIKAYQDTDNVKDGVETQKEINDKSIQTITSRAALKSFKPRTQGQTIFLQSVINGKNKGGGYFIYNKLSSKYADNGIIVPSNFGGNWERITLETWVNLQWFGVVSDGETDDQPSIMSAIQAFGDLSYNGLSNPTKSAFCTFHLPASDKTTVIKDTVWLLPYMRIIGDSAHGGSLALNYDQNSSTIETKFPLAENYKWAISTRNYVRATGQPTTWDSNYSGSNYDNGIVTACFGSQIKDIVLVNKDITKRVYGGIRMQNAPQCSVSGYVKGFDVGVYVGGAWRSRIDVDTECFKAGVVVFGDSNNPQINTYTHGNQNPSITPMPQQHQVFNGIDSTSGLENYATWKEKTYGSFLMYCYGFTGILISEYNDVGNLYANSLGTVTSAYCELNKIGNAYFASAILMGAIGGTNNTKAFAFGTGSRVVLPSFSSEHYSQAIRDGSDARYNSEILCPTTVNLSGPNVFYKNHTYRVFVNATSGEDTNNGMISDFPVKTIDKAIEIISKQIGSDGNQRSSSGKWSIIITDSSVYIPLVWSMINQDVTFEAIGGTPKIQFAEAIFWAVDCKVCFKGISITRANNNNFQTSSGGIIAKGGDVEVTIIDGDTACLGAPSLVSIDPDVTCNLTLTISNGTCSINNNSRFIELSKTKVVASSIKAAISQKFTGNVLSRADYGIESPSENITKVIIVNNLDSSKRVIP